MEKDTSLYWLIRDLDQIGAPTSEKEISSLSCNIEFIRLRNDLEREKLATNKLCIIIANYKTKYWSTIWSIMTTLIYDISILSCLTSVLDSKLMDQGLHPLILDKYVDENKMINRSYIWPN